MANQWEEEINDSQVDPCISQILNDLKNINTGVGQILAKFFNNGPMFSWSIESNSLGANAEAGLTTVNGITSTIVTEINSDRTPLASDLSIARTLIHEAVHAQLVYFRINDPEAARLSYSQILMEYGDKLDTNDQDHIKMTQDLIGFITIALKEYGTSKGYVVDDSYYAALAWGGLMNTPAFKAFPYATKEKIKEIVQIELTGKDANQNTVSQKGGNSGC